MPRRQLTFDLLGLCPGAEPHSLKATLTEGRSSFLTSGGEAVATIECCLYDVCRN